MAGYAQMYMKLAREGVAPCQNRGILLPPTTLPCVRHCVRAFDALHQLFFSHTPKLPVNLPFRTCYWTDLLHSLKPFWMWWNGSFFFSISFEQVRSISLSSDLLWNEKCLNQQVGLCSHPLPQQMGVAAQPPLLQQRSCLPALVFF